MAADLAELVIKVDSEQVRAATRGLEGLKRRGQAVQDRFTTMGRTAQKLGRQLSMWLTLPILGAGGMAVKTAADYETLRTQLEVLVGSAETARNVFNDLTQFAATTPFEIDGIVRANNLLLGFGVSIEQTQDLLRTLGDVSAVSGGDLFSMARIFGEARAEGKLLTRDLRQLVAQGVPVIKLLSDSMGVAENQIFELATAGEISFERLVAAFEMATEEGGLFFDGMGKRSNTLAGIFSNFADSVNISLASVGQTLIDTLNIKEVTRDLIAQIELATEWFNNLDSSTQRMFVSFGLFLAAIGPIIGILGTLSIAIGAISAPVLAVIAVTGVAAATIVSNWERIEAYFTSGGGSKMWKELQGIVTGTIDIIKGAWDIFGGEIMRITENAFTLIVEIVEASLTKINTIVQIWANVFNGNIKGALGVAVDDFRDTFGSMQSIVKSGLNLVWSVQPAVIWYRTISGLLSDTKEEFKNWAITDELGAFNTTIEESLTLLDEWSMMAGIKQAKEELEELSLVSLDGLFLGLDMFSQPEQQNKTIGELRSRIDELNKSIDGFSDPSKIREAQEEISFLERSIEGLLGKLKPRVEAEVFDEIIDNTKELERILSDNDISFEKYFPEGSIARIRQDIGTLQEEMILFTDPDKIQAHAKEIERLQDKIRDLTGETKQANQVANDLGFTFSSAFEDAIVSGNRLSDVLKGLYQDMLRIATRALITKPLGNALSGALSDVNPFGETSVDDALIRSDGSVVKFHPDDDLLAMKDLSKFPGGGSNVNINVHNNANAEVQVQERRNANGGVDIDVMLERKVKDMFAGGKMDKTMNRFGANRKPINRG